MSDEQLICNTNAVSRIIYVIARMCERRIVTIAFSAFRCVKLMPYRVGADAE